MTDPGGAIDIGIRPESKHLRRARSIARLLDSSISIPGTGRKIGLDPVLGLVPFIGDFGGALLSGYIVLAAAQAGVPSFTLMKMIINVGVDTLVGSVPLLGDFFDAAWKSNQKNVALFERHAGAGTPKNAYRLVSVVMVVSAVVFLALLTFVLSLVFVAARHSFTTH
ncbi:MAG: DUF4112 domain-containing protein [Gemmatimonadaceae bacterium]|nr:DUF4112 domain-containing protein [Gemmatimonadaceae bacterium]